MKKIKGTRGITILPYQDMSLKDLPNEKWAPIPGLDEYFLVSNFGRIKRLARETKRAGTAYLMAERIARVQMCKTLNTVKHDYTYQLFIRPMLDNRLYEFSIKRLVYYCFVKPFNLHDLSLNVIPKNGNGLDIRPDNLALVSIQKKINRTIKKGRMVNKFEYVDHDKAVRNSKKKTSKKIFQYDGSGKYLASYPSIHEAERQTGIGNNRICAVANGRQVTAGGFYWRHKKVAKINIDAI